MISSTTPAGLALVRGLLPWYANDSLEGPDHQFVDTWMQAHRADHPELAAELSWWRSTKGRWPTLPNTQTSGRPPGNH